MRNVPGRIVVTDSFHRSVKRRIEEVGATCCLPLQPGMRFLISDMMFADHEANMPGAVGPHDSVKQDGLALAIRCMIRFDLRRRFPLAGIVIRDHAQACQPLVDPGDGSPTRQGASGRIQHPRDRSHLAIIGGGGDRQETGLCEAGSSAQAETGSSQQNIFDETKGRERYQTHHGACSSSHRADGNSLTHSSRNALRHLPPPRHCLCVIQSGSNWPSVRLANRELLVLCPRRRDFLAEIRHHQGADAASPGTPLQMPSAFGPNRAGRQLVRVGKLRIRGEHAIDDATSTLAPLTAAALYAGVGESKTLFGRATFMREFDEEVVHHPAMIQECDRTIRLNHP